MRVIVDLFRQFESHCDATYCPWPKVDSWASYLCGDRGISSNQLRLVEKRTCLHSINHRIPELTITPDDLDSLLLWLICARSPVSGKQSQLFPPYSGGNCGSGPELCAAYRV